MKAPDQAAAVRRGAGLFRLPHRGLVAVEGADRVRWLDGMVSNDVSALAEGPERSGCQALLLTHQGRIVAELQILWRKGESSGQTQRLVEMRLDCDADTLLLLVDQTGVACHTGRRNCFFRAVRGGKLITIAEVEVDPKELYGK